MDCENAIAALRRHRAELKALGIERAAVFGSTARGDRTRYSDVDVLIELTPGCYRTVYDLVALQQAVASFIPGGADVVARDQLKGRLRDGVLADAVYAF